MEGTNAMCQMLMLQEEINKNQKGGNNNRDSGLFGLDVPPKPEVVKCFNDKNFMMIMMMIKNKI